MAITILAPAPVAVDYHEGSSSDEDGGVDIEGDIDMRLAKRARTSIVTPGETVTSDPQWMRQANSYSSSRSLLQDPIN
jgi:exosome complex component RRP4